MRHAHAASWVGAALFVTGLAAPTSSARADDDEPFLRSRMPSVPRSLELDVGAGYAQGFGNIAPGSSIASVTGAGVAVSGDVDYRMSHWVSFGLEAQYTDFANSSNAESRGLALDLGVTYHVSPGMRGDPWLRVGSGYRMIWDVDHVGAAGTTNMFHGFEVVALKLGYDVRTSLDVALSPVIGADLQTFVWEDAKKLSKVQLGTFLYVGVQGRFDLTAPAAGPPADVP